MKFREHNPSNPLGIVAYDKTHLQMCGFGCTAIDANDNDTTAIVQSR